MDSITQLTAEDAGAIVVSGSHGGVSSARYALEVPLRAVFFNDAGVGKDDAGIAALDILQAGGVACGAVSHASARIGDCEDMWMYGIVSHVNRAAAELGIAAGDRLNAALSALQRR